jgi:Protein of unknown function (DUF1538)
VTVPPGSLATPLLDTLRDVLPIVAILAFFQLAVLRRRIANLRRVLEGFLYVVVGLTLFVVGLEEALFPLGRTMAEQLTDPAFVGAGGSAAWWDYYWVYAFAAAIGFATTIAEPSLMAVSLKAEEASGGTVRPLSLRVAVATGVALSITVGALRIVTGTPLAVYMIVGYAIVIVQTFFAPRQIVPLAYDSGGVTTSTVTVPLVTALGLGLASTVPGRSALVDGFGLIALASLFPIVTVLGYAQLASIRDRQRKQRPT